MYRVGRFKTVGLRSCWKAEVLQPKYCALQSQHHATRAFSQLNTGAPPLQLNLVSRKSIFRGIHPVYGAAIGRFYSNLNEGSAKGALPTHARVVICGGGVIGTSLAYHLALQGWTDVVLLEQGR